LKNIFESLTNSWPGSPEEWTVDPMFSPQQNNVYDCGVFLIAAFDCLRRGKPLAYTAKDVPMLRQRIAQNLYQGKWQDLL
jgi:Ulp1 family protease